MIIDTNVNVTPHLAALKAAGVTTIIRYLSPINPKGEKCIKPAEAQAIAKAGLRLALVCEGWGDFAHGGISAGAGERDGAWCVDYARSLGAPEGAVIYYAVDVDASAAQIKKLVLPYFGAVLAAHAGTPFHFGAYGSGAVCEAVRDAAEPTLTGMTWLSGSLGWSGSRAYLASNKWTLRQHPPGNVAGIGCDQDDAGGEFGDFMPFAAASPSIIPVVTATRAPPSQAQQFLDDLVELIGRYRGL